MLGVKTSQTFLNKEQLIELIFTWKKGIAVNQFSHNTPHSPNINRTIIRRPNQELWWSVPPCRHVVGIVLSWLFERTGKTEITNLKLFGFGDEKVFGFDVSVDDVVGMHVCQALDQLINNIFY